MNNYMNTLSEAKQIILNGQRASGTLDYRKLRHLINKLSQFTKCQSDDYIEVCYWIMNDISEAPLCPFCNKPSKFMGFTYPNGYQKFCSSKCAGASEKVLEKRRSTCMALYGVDTIMKVPEYKESLKRTFMKNYGVDNPSKHASVMCKKEETCLKNYGTKYFLQSKEGREQYVKTCMERYGVINTWQLANHDSCSKKANRIFEELYDKLSDEDKKSYVTGFLGPEMALYDPIYDRYYLYDFVIKRKMLVVEFQGNYWHMNPKTYGPMEYNESRNMFAFEIWEYDARKRN